MSGSKNTECQVECQVVKTFWNEVELWIYDRLGVLFNLTVCEIIFVIRELDELIRLVYYIMVNFISINNKHIIKN